MAILATLRRSGGISALSRQLGASPTETMAAANVLIPELIADFQSYSGGMRGLLALIEEAGGGALAQAIMGHEPIDPQPGIKLLARIQRISAVPEAAQATDGQIDPELRLRMLPLLAMLLGGYLAARASGGGLDVAELSSLLEARKSFYSPGEEQV